MKKIYVTLTAQQLNHLSAGEEVEIVIGKRSKRYLTTKSEIERKREAIEAEYKKKIADLG